MNSYTKKQSKDGQMGEIVKRKNIGEETMRESQPEMDNDKVERLSETIFMLMLELKMVKKQNKELRIKNLENTQLGYNSEIGGSSKERIEYYKKLSEELQREVFGMGSKLDKFKNQLVEFEYYKENFVKIDELYLMEQQKRKFLEGKLGELNAHEISIIEETFEQKFKYTKFEEKHVKQTTEYFEEVRRTANHRQQSSQANSNRVGTFYVQPSGRNSGSIDDLHDENKDIHFESGDFSSEKMKMHHVESQNISLLSKNIQKRVKQSPKEFNLNSKELQREIYILSKEVDRLNIENQKFLEENIILTQKLREGLDAPEYLSDKFASNGSRGKDYMFMSGDMNQEGVSELVSQPIEILVPNDKNKFNQLLSNDNTFFMKERVTKLEVEIEEYIETIKEMEDSNNQLQKKVIRLENSLRVQKKETLRESQKMERENSNLKNKLDQVKNSRTSNFDNGDTTAELNKNNELMKQMTEEREYYKILIQQKQREIIRYKQLVKDNGLDLEMDSEQSNNHEEKQMQINEVIEEEEHEGDSFGSNRLRPVIAKKVKRVRSLSKMQQTQESLSLIKQSDTEEEKVKSAQLSFNNLDTKQQVNKKTKINEEKEELNNRVRELEAQLQKIKGNYQLEKQDLNSNLEKNEQDLKLLLRRNTDLEDEVERLRTKQTRLKEKFKNQINFAPKEGDAEEELYKNLKNSVIKQNLDKIKNISTSLLNEKEQEYQKEMRKLKLTMQNIDKAHLSSKNRELLSTLRKKKSSHAQPEDNNSALTKENKILKENLEVYKEEVNNMMDLIQKIEAQVEELEKENNELHEDIESCSKELEKERDSYKDLKEQYLDQIELNNRRNKEIMMIKNQLSRKNNSAGDGTGMGNDTQDVERLTSEILDKNEVITMLKNDIRDKEAQKIHLSSKLKEIDILFRDLERENTELRNFKKLSDGEGGSKQEQLYVQIIRQQQSELKEWRSTQLTAEEIMKLQPIIRDQHREIKELKERLTKGGEKSEDSIENKDQLMGIIRKQQDEIDLLRDQLEPEGEGSEVKNSMKNQKPREQELLRVVKEQLAEIADLKAKVKSGGSGSSNPELIKIIEKKQKEINELKLNDGKANSSELIKVIEKQQNEINQLKLREGGSDRSQADNQELMKVINSQQEEIKQLRHREAVNGNGNSQELRNIIDRLQNENNQLRSNGTGQNQGNNPELQQMIQAQQNEINALRVKANANKGGNTEELMRVIQTQQNELNDLRSRGGMNPENTNQLMGIIKGQQSELNQLRMQSASQDGNEELIEMLKEKQNEINQLRMDGAGTKKNSELTRIVQEQQNEINNLKLKMGNQQSIDKLMKLVNEKQEEVNQLRIQKNSNKGSEKLLNMVKEKQEEINMLRREQAATQGSEDLLRMLQEKQAEINRMRMEQPTSQDPNQARREIELQNQVSQLKQFEEKSRLLEDLVNGLERKNKELQEMHPNAANEQRLGQIIQEQQKDLDNLKSQLGGQDWNKIVKKLETDISRLKPENQRLKDTLRQIQEVNNTNKTIYLTEKETLTREINTLHQEIQIREERIVEVQHTEDIRHQELEAEVQELSEMVNQVMGNQVGYEGKYREQKAINKNWEEKANKYDGLKQLYDHKLIENENKVITQNALELKMFVLITEMRIAKEKLAKYEPHMYGHNQNSNMPGINWNKANPEQQERPKTNLYQGPNRFNKKTASPQNQNPTQNYRNSSPYQNNNYSNRNVSPRMGSNPLQKRLNRDSFKSGSPGNYPNQQPHQQNTNNPDEFMIVRNNDGTYVKAPVRSSVSPNQQSHSHSSQSRTVTTHNTQMNSRQVRETRTQELSYSPIQQQRRPTQGTAQNRILSRNEKISRKADIFSSTTTQKKKVYRNDPNSTFARLKKQ